MTTVLVNQQIEYNGLLMGPGTDFYIEDVSGLGEVAHREETLARSLAHGAYSYVRFIEHRVVTIRGVLIAATPAARVASLESLAQAFLPQSTDQPLRFLDEGDTTKRIFAKPVRRQFPTRDKMVRSGIVEFAIQLVAADPRIYGDAAPGVQSVGVQSYEGLDFGGDGTPNDYSTGIDFGGDGTPNDYSAGIDFGGGSSGTGALENDGIITTYPVIDILGPADNPRVRNLTTDESLGVVGLTIPEGHFLRLDMANHSIMLDALASRYSYIDPLQNTFWGLAPGPNTIQFTALNTGPSTLCQVSYRSAWI